MKTVATKTFRTEPSAGTAPIRPSLSSLLLRGLYNAARSLVREMRIRRDMRHLESLSDNILSDIGISRGHITHALREGRVRPDAARPVPRTRKDRDLPADMSNIVKFIHPAKASSPPICGPGRVATSFATRK